MGAPAQHFDQSAVITTVHSVEEARSLPPGSVVGDRRGGVTFSDAVANILEQRSTCGWMDVDSNKPAEHWTVIYLNR